MAKLMSGRVASATYHREQISSWYLFPDISCSSAGVVGYLILSEDRAGFQQGGDGGRILEPKALHEVVNISLLRKRYGVSIAIARHPYPKGPAPLPLAGYPILLAEHLRHTVNLLTGSTPVSSSTQKAQTAQSWISHSPMRNTTWAL